MSEEAEGSSILSKTTEAVRDAAQAVQATTQSIADAVKAGRRPGAPLDQLARLTRQAPLQSLAIAFLLGALLARRR
jgi:Xaa-Pro aminopeptidase